MMRRWISERWFGVLLGVLVVLSLYLQYLVFENTERLKVEELRKTRAYAEHIVTLLKERTNGRFYETLLHNEAKRKELESLLEAFLIPKYEYIFVIKREKRRRYRFLLDGSKEDKEAFGSLFVPVNRVYDEVYDSGEVRIVKQQDDTRGVWVSLLYPVVRNGKSEAMLILDLSERYGRALEDFNMPLRQVIYYVQAVLILAVLILLVLGWRYRTLRKKLYIDSVSGAYTKAFMFDHMASKSLERYDVLLIDIDEFREINKVYGYETGDALLRRFVETLQRLLPPNAYVVRLSGAEFFVFVSKEGDRFDRRVSEWFDSISDEVYRIEKYEITLRVSIAAMTVPEYTQSIQYIQHTLYEALLEIKSRGKNAYTIVDVKSYDELKYRQIDYLQQLIEKGNIAVLYQPICEVISCRSVKYEALVRLIDDNGIQISPGKFMEVIRGTSLYIKLSKLVFKDIFEHMRANPKLHLSVNLDLDDLYNRDMMRLLTDFLHTCPDEAKRLTFEILESRNIDDYSEVNRVFTQLRFYGSKVAIDDFGSGYANFLHMLYLDVDIIKIDGSLIRELSGENGRIEEVLRMILDLAHRFGFKVVAEFVENEEIYERIKALGFDYAQGYYFGKPEALALKD